MRRYAVLLVGLVVLAGGLVAVQHWTSDPCRNGRVELTFDDGPTTTTTALLAALKAEGLTATFFDQGDRTNARPALVRQELAEGHRVGNHSYNHPHLRKLSRAKVYSELDATQLTIQHATGITPTVFRPPYGEGNQTTIEVAQSLGMTHVLWDVNTKDYEKGATPASIAARVNEQVGDTSVILLHDGLPVTVDAIPLIADVLKEKRLCT